MNESMGPTTVELVDVAVMLVRERDASIKVISLMVKDAKEMRYDASVNISRCGHIDGLVFSAAIHHGSFESYNDAWIVEVKVNTYMFRCAVSADSFKDALDGIIAHLRREARRLKRS